MKRSLFDESIDKNSSNDTKFYTFSKIEEMLIKKEDLPEYYRLKRKYNYDRKKLVSGTWWRDMLQPILVKLISLNRKFIDKQQLSIINDVRTKKNEKNFIQKIFPFIKDSKSKPVIYAITHIDKYDYQVVSEAIKEHQYPFAGDPETMYRTLDGTFLELNGVIYCDTESKEDRHIAKETAIETLKQGHNLLIYPEGVWNLTSNLLMLPLFPGIIEMAKETGCDIVPVAIERYDKEYKVNIGSEFDVNYYLKSGLTDDEVRIKLRDEMATLKWDIMQTIPNLSSAEEDYYNTVRSELGEYDEELEKFQTERLKEWTNPETGEPYYNKNIIKDRTYREKDTYTGFRVSLPEDAFSYMKKIKLSKNNSFMLRKDSSLPQNNYEILSFEMKSNFESKTDDNERIKNRAA